MAALEWEGCLNVRDLGGLPTRDGGRTRSRSVIRADNVRLLTEAGRRALASYGVARVVDLRYPEEVAEDAPVDLGVEVVHVSVLGERLDPAYVAELDRSLFAAADVADHYAWSYVDFLERHRDRFGTAFAAVASADGCVVVHCMGGKDRTGLVSGLLLRLAGVELDTVGADYALSERNLASRTRRWIEAAGNDAWEREKRQRLSPSPAAGIVRALAEIERGYGDAVGYLRAAGLDRTQIERLRMRLAPA